MVRERALGAPTRRVGLEPLNRPQNVTTSSRVTVHAAPLCRALSRESCERRPVPVVRRYEARACGAATFSSGRLSCSGTPYRLSLLPARAVQCPAMAAGASPNKGSQAQVRQQRPRRGDVRVASPARSNRSCSLQQPRSAHTVPPELLRAREARLGFNGCGRGAGTHAWTPRLAQKKFFDHDGARTHDLLIDTNAEEHSARS